MRLNGCSTNMACSAVRGLRDNIKCKNFQVLRYYSAPKYMYYQTIATSTHISRSSVVVTVHSRSRHPVGVAVTSSRGLRYFESGPSTVPDVNSSPTVPSSAESSVLSFTDKQEG